MLPSPSSTTRDPLGSLACLSPRGHPATLWVRTDTNDAATIHSTWHTPDGQLHDEYGTASRHLAGWALDVGAHIGSVALALALDNPDLRVLAVECVPENVEMLRVNAAAAGVADRVIVVPRAAAAPGVTTGTLFYGPYDVPGIPAEHAMQARYIGNVFRHHGPRETVHEVPAVSLDDLLAEHAITDIAFCKIDCEGAEWGFLATPAVAAIAEIVGEYHDRPWPAIAELLAPTHDVELLHDAGGCGLFRAVRR